MPRKVNVIGVGMVPFAKPGKSEEYHVMATKAGTAALADAKIPFDQVQQAFAGYVYGDSTCGQRAIYQLGLTGIPVFNVNNNCSTGSSALMLGAQAIAGGMAECVLVVGFEQMEPGALSAKWTDRANPLDKFVQVMNEEQGFTRAPRRCSVAPAASTAGSTAPGRRRSPRSAPRLASTRRRTRTRCSRRSCRSRRSSRHRRCSIR